MDVTTHSSTPRVVDDRQLLRTRLGPVGYRDVGSGRPIVFVAGAVANGDLWNAVVPSLAPRFRCVMVDLPLGAHHVPLDAGADRSARSLARLILDVLVELALDDGVLVANDTAGGLTLLALGEQHEGLRRIGALVLTNCDSFEHFPPKSLRPFAFLCRHAPRFAGFAFRRSLRSDRGRRRLARSVAATALDERLEHSLFDPSANAAISADFVAAFAGFRPSILLEATPALEQLAQPVLLAWGDADTFFPVAHAQRLAATFPKATMTTIAGAKTWVPLDKPDELAAAIAAFAA
ncbi:MAG TPA: alpha/beta hydrolase [Acidimicrobiales bacterium]|jgi:pimeloyl-ACP methyl ester carboxylesterase